MLIMLIYLIMLTIFDRLSHTFKAVKNNKLTKLGF